MKKIFALLSCIILVFAFTVLTYAASGDVRYYVDLENGNNRSSGKTPAEAVETLSRAMNLAISDNDAERVIITLMSPYEISSSFTESGHKLPFVLTTLDGGTDYAKTRDARIIFGDTLRYYLNGDTTFENISFDYSTSINFVAGFNPITFGEGISFTSKGITDNGIYVVGGWQSPDDAADRGLDSHITIKSGNFAVVVGGSRQKKSGSGSNTYTGTHYINISGGSIASLYAGTLLAHKAGSAVLDISGGNIETLYLSEVGSRLNGTAKITLSGGKIDEFMCYGAVKGEELTLCGGTVGKMTAGCQSERLEYLRIHAGGETVLKYDADIYTEKQIAAFTGFDKVISSKAAIAEKESEPDDFTPVEGVVFVSGDGSGNGQSPMKATNAIEVAYAKLAKTGGTIVISGKYEHRSKNKMQNSEKVTITSVYDGVDYAKTNAAEIVFFTNFYCGGETEFRDITLTATDRYQSIVAGGNKLHIGENVTSVPAKYYAKYLCLVAGSASNGDNINTEMVIDSGTWDRVRGGSSGSAERSNVSLTVNGGVFYDFTLASKNAHSGNIEAVINGGEFRRGVSISAYDGQAATFNGNVDLTINGGLFYGELSVSRDNKGVASGSFNLTINGGNLDHIDKIEGSSNMSGNMTSTLSVTSLDLGEKIDGEMTFTNPIRLNGADPWIFYHDGYFYYTASEGKTLSLARARNLGDLKHAESKVIYSPAAGHPWSSQQWSPEIHYYTDEQVGKGNGGWYCYVCPCSEGDSNHRLYVLKCLDGDNLLGRWGNPITGEVNVPERVVAPDVPDWDSTWTAGQSSIIINGKAYILYVGMSKERVENNSLYQYICIAPLTNPWTIIGTPTVICTPEYDWEKISSLNGSVQVVEGATAVYGNDGSVYIVYSANGYYSTEYQLGELKYVGGDPMDAKNWVKKPTSIFRQNNILTGSGHASYVTDQSGQGWICYHAYVGDPNLPSNKDAYEYGEGRLAFVEPYYADKNGVVIADGTKKPAPLDKVYTVKLDETPIGERTGGFDEVKNSLSLYDALAILKSSPETAKELMKILCK